MHNNANFLHLLPDCKCLYINSLEKPSAEYKPKVRQIVEYKPNSALLLTAEYIQCSQLEQLLSADIVFAGYEHFLARMI
jgi:hypothetical protein